MINPHKFINEIQSQGIKFVVGVPDSLLKDFLFALDSGTSNISHFIAANEGNAIAIASGHYISTGVPAIVYMQNSGLGNAINPLVSLADSEVYGIPMLLIIGWRGKKGESDEPQHVKQGRITEDLLRVLEIPFLELNSESDFVEILNTAINRMQNELKPVAILVNKGTFEKTSFSEEKKANLNLTREDSIEKIVGAMPKNCLIVATTGMTSRELFEIRKRKKSNHSYDFLTVGSMGHASSIALGIALNIHSRKIICLDGDGSFLMHMGANGVIGQSNLNNFNHILINNGAHDSVGGQPTVALNLNFHELSHSLGYKNYDLILSADTLENKVRDMLVQDGPNFLEIRVTKGSRNNLGRPDLLPKDNLKKFMKNISNNEL